MYNPLKLDLPLLIRSLVCFQLFYLYTTAPKCVMHLVNLCCRGMLALQTSYFRNSIGWRCMRRPAVPFRASLSLIALQP